MSRRGHDDQEAGAGQGHEHNPKLDPHPGSNTEKDPHDWVTGDEPMTGAQASYLQTLCEEAGETFEPGLSKAQASMRIDELRARTGKAGHATGRDEA